MPPRTTLSSDDRKKLLQKYDLLRKKGKKNQQEAAKELGYSTRAIQKWIKGIGFQPTTMKQRRSRPSSIKHIEDDLIQFIHSQQKRHRRPIRNVEVEKKATELCTNFRSKTPAAQRMVIKRFLCRASLLLPRPHRHKTTSEQSTKIGKCIGMNCVSACRRREKCVHKRIVGRQHKAIEKIKNIKGNGLIVKEQCTRGDFVIEYFGRIIAKEELRVRDGRNSYWMKVGRKTIDGNIPRNKAKFINHSCDPNCRAEVWDVNGDDRAIIIALKPIKAGDELTFDYRWSKISGAPQIPCLCGSKKCRKFIDI